MRLASAMKLIGVAGEEARWQQSLGVLKEERDNLVGTMVVGAAHISYLGTFTSKYRRNLMSTWGNVLEQVASRTTLTPELQTLADPVKVRNWHLHGCQRTSWPKMASPCPSRPGGPS